MMSNESRENAEGKLEAVAAIKPSSLLARKLQSREERIQKQQQLQNPTDRCTGHCCRSFTAPDLANIRRDLDLGLASDLADRETISEMLIPIDDTQTYTCIHYDESSGNCGNYAGRPKMCSEYPYGDECGYAVCTWKAARPKPYEKNISRISLRILQGCSIQAKIDDFEKRAKRGDWLRGEEQIRRLASNAITARLGLA